MPFTPWASTSSTGGGQQPYQFRPESYGAKGDGIKCLVTTVAGNAQITAASPVFTSTAVDGGKDLMVCGAGGAIPGGPWITQIASVQSATVATMTSTCPVGGSGAGLAAVFSSDDRLAIDACVTAASAYAQGGAYLCQVLFGAKIYGLGASLFQSAAGVSGALLTYNTQVRLPVPSDQTGETGDKLECALVGAGTGGQNKFWMNTNATTPGTALVSYSPGPNTADPTFGQQSVVGGPIGGTGLVGGDNGFFNAKTVVEGITIVQPGWSNSIGLDLLALAGCRIDGVFSTVLSPSTNDGGGVNPSNAWITAPFWLSNKIGTGYRLPGLGNNDEILLNSIAAEGLNNGIITTGDHVVIVRAVVISCDEAVRFGSLGAGVHAVTIGQLSWENCNACVAAPAGTGAQVQCDIWADGENVSISGADVNDPNGNLYGTLQWSDVFRSPGVPTITGAANLTVINNRLGPGLWSGAPAAPGSGTAQKNTAYRAATIYLHATTSITAVSVNGTALGNITAGANQTVRVPPGATYTVTYTGTLTTQWVLD